MLLVSVLVRGSLQSRTPLQEHLAAPEDALTPRPQHRADLRWCPRWSQQDGVKGFEKRLFPRILDLLCAEMSRAAGALVCAAVRSACAAVSQRVHSLSLCQSVSRPFFTLCFILTSPPPPHPHVSAFVPPFCLAEGRDGGCGC